MAGWQSLAGQTLLVPSGPTGLHLFVLILGPVAVPNAGPKPKWAMVSATSVRPGIPHDTACELQPGDHPFVKHDSFIAYRYMRLEDEPHVVGMVGKSVWTPNSPCSPELLQRIVKGVCISKLTPREYKRLFGCI